MFSRPARLTLLFAASLLGALPAPAETPPLKPPQPAAPTDAAVDAEKAAFLALPLATRVAAQDALVWLGLYNGASDGDFGKRTRDSIVAFQLTQKGNGDGVLSAGQLQALLAARQKAEAAAGFKISVDPKTGARIGTPTKLIDAKSGVTLDFALDASGDLLDLYARLAADTPTRKVAYKALKPGAFFVVSGLDGGKKFYARYELETGANPPVRGFEFAYPAGRKDLDRVALAVAKSFVAYPQAGAATGAATPAAEPPTGSAPPPQPAAPSATALIVAPGRALTALKPEDCPKPERRREAGPVRAVRRGDRSRDALRRLRRQGRADAARRARARPHRAERRRGARRGHVGFARRRGKAGRRRVARQERGGRPCVRPFGRARGPRRPGHGRAETRRGRRARRPAPADRRRGNRRLPGRRDADAACRPGSAQRGRDRRTEEDGGRRGDVRKVTRPNRGPPLRPGSAGR